MFNECFAAFLYALPLILGGVLCLFVLVGFWRGLSLRANEPERRAPPLRTWWGGEL